MTADPFKRRDELRAEAKALRDTLAREQRAMTDAEAERVKAMTDELAELDTRCEAIETATKALGQHVEAAGRDYDEHGARAKRDGRGLGTMLVESDAYKAWVKAHPTGASEGTPIEIKAGRVGRLADLNFKAGLVTSDAAHVQNLRFPMVDLAYQARPTLLDVVTRGEAAGAFEYLQIIAVENNAAVVPEAESTTDDKALKPTSGIETNLADAKPYTYADGYDATNSLLKDAPALATFLDARLGQNLEVRIEDVLLNGTGTNGQPRGVFNTTGVLQQDFATDFVTTVRKAITRLQTATDLMTRITGVVINPEDDEAWDLLQDENGRYYGGGPFATGPRTAWGYPRLVSSRIPKGTALIGDLTTIALLDVEGLSVLAFNQHKDYAQRNLTYVRAELRASQAVFEPARLCIADLTAGGGGAG